MLNAVLFGFVPFLVGDSIKIVLATVVLPIGWKIMAYRSKSKRNSKRDESADL
jgi:biotin transporter BioY